MSRWFRHYAGMMRDEKLVRVALKAKQPIERVLWVWGAILESAAEIDNGGRYDFDEGEAAYFLRADEMDIRAIVTGLVEAARIAEGAVANWSDRQFISDRSNGRVSAFRERKKRQNGEGNVSIIKSNEHVTLQSPPGNAPETETETEDGLLAREDVSRETIRPTTEDWDKLRDKLVEAAGWQRQRANGKLEVLGPIVVLLDSGADLELDVLPVIRRDAARCHSPNWFYFSNAIAQARDDRLATAKLKFEGKPHASNTHKPNTVKGGFAIIDAELAELERKLTEEETGSASGGEGELIQTARGLPGLRENAA